MLEALSDFKVDEKHVGALNADEIVGKYKNIFFERMIIDITAIKNYDVISNIQKVSMNLDMNKIVVLLDDSELCSSPSFISTLVSMGIYNFATNLEGIEYLLKNPNDYKDVVHLQTLNRVDPFAPGNGKIVNNSYHIVGIKNITPHAGATTLTYMMYRELKQSYQVAAIEVGTDFSYFYDKGLTSTTGTKLRDEIGKNSSKDIILIDLNETGDENFCDAVLYLVEPSTIKLNKLFKNGTKVLDSLREKRIVLNISNLNNMDLEDFESEAHLRVFADVPSLNDKNIGHDEIKKLLLKLGFNKVGTAETNDDKKSIFVDLFKNV